MLSVVECSIRAFTGMVDERYLTHKKGGYAPAKKLEINSCLLTKFVVSCISSTVYCSSGGKKKKQNKNCATDLTHIFPLLSAQFFLQLYNYSYFIGTKMQQSRKTCSRFFAVCFFPIFSVHFHYRWCQLRKWIWEGGSSLHARNPFTVWKEKALKMLYNDLTTRYSRRCKCGSTPGISWLRPRRSPRLQSLPRSPPPSNLWENVGNEGNDLRG